MPTITPPLPPQPPTITPTPAPVLTVTNPPVELARLTIGGVLEAVVTSQSGKDTFVLQTPIGPLSVQAPVLLPKDANLVLQILSLSPQAQLQINQLNDAAPSAAFKAGQPPARVAGQENLVAAEGKISGPQQTTTPPLLAGTIIRAALVRPLAASATAPAITPGAAALPTAGTAAAPGPAAPPGTLATGIQPSPASGPKSTVPLPGLPGTGQLGGTAAPSAPATGTPGPAAAGNPTRPGGATSPVLPTGTQVSFKITDVQLPSPASNNVITPPNTSGSMALAAGKILTGVVTGTTAAGHPVVQTEAGVFSLNAQSSVPRGSMITLEVTTAPKTVAPAATAPAHPGQEVSSIFADRRWPPLEEALQVLHDASPAASRQLVHTALPRPDVQLTSGLIFFMSALRGGDLRSWFGESNLRILEKSQPNLARRLSSDFNIMGRIADEPVGADWRVAMIPVNTGDQIEQIRLLLRHHDSENDDDTSGDQGTRFILDVNLSRLGRIQLDGLVRDNGRKLDLIIRSGDSLDDDNRNEIRRIFTEAASLTGLNGSVGFQASPPDYIDIPDPLAEHMEGLVV